MSVDKYNATIIQKILVTQGLMIIRVKLDDIKLDFKPGQYTVLGLTSNEPRIKESDPEDKTYDKETLLKRAYSISSASIEKDYLEFYISIVRSGQLTPRLFALEREDRLFIGKKAVGLFTLDKAPRNKNILFVATGTGLAPYMSMIRTELNLKEPRKFVVLQGGRYSWDLGYRDELATLDRMTELFFYIPAITRPSSDLSWSGLTGRIQALVESGVIEEKTGLELNPENFDVFLCGNPLMVEEVSELLVSKGFNVDKKKETGNVHREKYW
tara:strand:- start:9523 stop:10332 length:810 start_codon:yes stop_codon:yes gene_type:complete